ncbi:MAG: DNA alkylation repair protein [Paludibacter sp.]
MKYFISNPELDAQISEIRLKIRLSMNGIVSEQMTQKGILYKKNYGVSIPRIKEIASGYQPNHELAQRLWALKIRETMIIATLLQPIDSFSPELAHEWAETFNQIEIVEQLCMNIFSKLTFAAELCFNWICSDNLWIQITGFSLAARVFEKIKKENMILILEKAVDISPTEYFHLYKSIAVCLSRFCRKDKEIATYIHQEINKFHPNESVGQQFILSEVEQEILFSGIL